ncbi:uncharacterized protein LOC130898167 [Diorhabda carinulata]|uniref:uncharacterized protein LOC130898167 n=1 Tax=Diorhabda carinulata TaxID=1163345 RepID=UPI0025A2D116|nr:uncharacterized protein LOC130898167 [Diorhabda carinulata]
MWKFKFLVLFSLLVSVRCYNFLGIFPFSSKSHMQMFSSLVKELAAKGHNVTVVSVFPENGKLPNYTDIDISNEIPSIMDSIDMSSLKTNSRLSKYLTVLFLSKMADMTCQGLSSKLLRNFLNTSGSFDAIITEDFNSECYFSVFNKINVPVIGMSSSGILPWVYTHFGIPCNPAIVPNILLPYTNKMSFFQRLENTLVTFMYNMWFKFHRREKEKQIVRSHMGEEASNLESYTQNLRLLLVNTHYSLTLTKPTVPNVIEVGGIHIKQPKVLPKDLKDWIEGSTDGVIYFSMGSLLRGYTFPIQKREAFIKAFNSLPYRVLWKFENETMEGASDKILVRDWLPQLDILCHPNVKLFISHGGLLGMLESVYCGVPMIIIPHFGDQFNNAAALEANEGGIILNVPDITEATALQTIKDAINLSRNAKILSERFKDRPLPPLETAVYWTEYVVRHKGASFMKSAAVDMPFYQYYLLDVLTFLACISTITICLIIYICKLILRKVGYSLNRMKAKLGPVCYINAALNFLIYIEMYCLNVIIIILSILSVCNCLNILFMITFYGKSHYLAFESLIKQMSKKGHNVTVIINTKINKFGDYRVINIMDDSVNKTEVLSMNIATELRTDLYKRVLNQREYSNQCCSKMKSKNFLNFYNENVTFDIIVAEVFNTNCFFGLQAKFNAPIVGITTTDFLPWMYQWFGCPENPSYIPVLFMDYSDRMNFLQRLENTLMLVYSKFIHFYYIGPSGNEYSKKYLGVDLYQGGDILYNISLLLINRHYSFQTPKPLTPNVIEVGGIHIEPPKKLPKNLERIVSNSKEGVILMSMGSTLKGSTFPEKQRKLFLKVFSQLNHTILWKWENDTMEGLPANVKIQKWLPQLDLLCHPNVKLFITHGGLLGTQEAVYCAVPMLILPQFADQHYNAALLKKSGATLNLKLRTTTEEELTEAINKLFSPEFSKNAKALSDRFKDRPMSPMDTAIYWIEYVARHKGAPFMKSAVTDLPFYQSLLLDVIAFLILVMLISINIIYLFIKYTVSVFRFKTEPKIKIQ